MAIQMAASNGMQMIERYPARVLLGGGAVSGVASGVVMMIVAMIVAYARGTGVFAPPKLIAATLMGNSVFTAVAGAVILGLVIHFLVSAFYGFVFAWITARMSTVYGLAAAGTSFGIVVWLGMTYLVLPWANPILRAQVSTMPTAWFVYHVIFGVALALTPFFERVTAPTGRPSYV